MKIIVIGLGNFGLSIAQKLTALGHEIIGVDKDLNRVEEYKNEMNLTVCINPTEEHAMRSLPIRECDAAIISMGQDVGDSIISTAIIKQLGAKRIIVRSVTKVHENILTAIGVDEIIDVTTFASQTYSLKLSTQFARGLFMVDEKYAVFETDLPARFMGAAINSLRLEENHRLQFIAIKRYKHIKKVFGDPRSTFFVVEDATEMTLIEEGDRIVVYGKLKEFTRFTDLLKL